MTRFPKFDFNELYLFVQVVKAGSFSAAGRSLNIPKATVSRKVAQLEANLETRLLYRTTRHLSLTEVGRLYYDRCTRILADLEEANLMVTAHQDIPHGTLRLTAPFSFGNAILNRWLAAFLDQYPQVTLDVILTNQYLDLLTDRIDVAFSGGPLEESSLSYRKVCDLPYWVCASSTYLETYGVPETPFDLLDHRCLCFATGSAPAGYPWRFKQDQEEIEIIIPGRVLVNDVTFARRAVLSGFGITYLPGTLVRDDILQGRLVHLLTAWPMAEREVFMVYRGDRLLAPKVQAFLEFVEEQIPSLRDWLTSAA
ncbi:MAG: LysR family transcriptional regulator [Leptolyngbya sp. SIO1D8]|nr:LysR family transcriptional regulator [Leptolyngbya sp. SIO1D8]